MVAEDLKKNGLELESVSLTSLDQTDKQFFDPNNAFDAEGLTLTEQTEARRKQRNDVEQDTEVQVMDSALQYQLAKPIVDAVMKDAGLSNEGITGVAQSLSKMLTPADGGHAVPLVSPRIEEG